MANGWHRKSVTPAEVRRRAEYNSPEYRAARRAGAKVVASGEGQCWRCHQPIGPDDPWHVGHDDNDRTIIRGIECPPCNLKAAARKGARIGGGARKRPTSPLTW